VLPLIESSCSGHSAVHGMQAFHLGLR
jgi:hypothetical protein